MQVIADPVHPAVEPQAEPRNGSVTPRQGDAHGALDDPLEKAGGGGEKYTVALKSTATCEIGKYLTEHTARNRKFEYYSCSTSQQ